MAGGIRKYNTLLGLPVQPRVTLDTLFSPAVFPNEPTSAPQSGVEGLGTYTGPAAEAQPSAMGTQPAEAPPSALGTQPADLRDVLANANMKLRMGIPLTQQEAMLMGPQAGVSGGGSATSTSRAVERTQVNHTPEMMAAEQRQQDLIAGMRNRAIALGKQEADVGLQNAQDLTATVQQGQAEAAAAAQRLAKHNQDMQALMARMDAETADWQKSAANVDPNRLMHGAGGWLAALGMALGAFGAALTKTPDTAMQIVQNAMDRDLNKQKMLVDAKRGKLSITQQLYQNAQTQFQSDEAARQYAQAQTLQIAGLKLKTRAAQLTGSENQANLQQNIDQLDLAAQQKKADALRLENTVRMGTTTTTQARPSAFVSPLEAAAKAAELNAKLGVVSKPTTQDLQRDKAASDKIAAIKATVDNATRFLGHASNAWLPASRHSMTVEGHREEASLAEMIQNDALAKSGKQLSEKELQYEMDKFTGGVYTEKALAAKTNELMANGVNAAIAYINQLPPAMRVKRMQELQDQLGGPEALQSVLEGNGVPSVSEMNRKDAAAAGMH